MLVCLVYQKQCSLKQSFRSNEENTVADPGFPKPGRQNSKEVVTYYLTRIFQKLHKSKEERLKDNWIERVFRQ